MSGFREATSRLGKAIQRLMAKRGMSQIALAARLGSATTTISAVVHGHAPLTIPMAVRLGRALYVDPLVLVTLWAQDKIEEFEKEEKG
jgi:plasmid maintenance system antidote protein VapI